MSRYAKKDYSFQIDATYPLDHITARNFGLYLHVQYVNSLAESLLHCEERTEAMRIGFAIVR